MKNARLFSYPQPDPHPNLDSHRMWVAIYTCTRSSFPRRRIHLPPTFTQSGSDFQRTQHVHLVGIYPR